MATETKTPAGSDEAQTVEKKIEKFRELFADAPEIGKKAWRTRFTSSDRDFGSAAAGGKRRPVGPVWARCRS